MSTIRVRLAINNNQELTGQLLVGSKASKRLPLSAFNEEMQTALKQHSPGEEVPCAANPAPTPENVRPAPVSRAAAPSAPASRAGIERTGGPPPNLGYRPTGKAPERTPTASVSSALERNPYNFAEWVAAPDGQPWKLPDGPSRDSVTHDSWRADRLSGAIAVRLTARTPVFIPQGDLHEEMVRKADRTRQTFWHCRHPDGAGRLALPGSSVKGVVRTLYETWTNSRLTLVSDRAHGQLLGFRRRTAKLWVIERINPNGDLTLRACDVDFAHKQGGRWVLRSKQAAPPDAEIVDAEPVTGSPDRIDPTRLTHWQALRYRANLLWTPDHTHVWTHLLVKVRSATATIAKDLVDRYRRFVEDNEAIGEHPERIDDIIKGGPGKNYYSNIRRETAALDSRRADLVRLEPGDWVFGIPDGTRLACFGKNVNLMFPAAKRPRDLLGAFAPREEDVTLADADSTQLAFGYAGAYGRQGEPFRGRIRFGTFWLTGEAAPRVALQLRALTSPTGVKLKARSLYLPPGTDRQTETYDEATRLRGRKFYWHQRSPDDRVSPDHLTTKPDNQCPPEIEAVATGAVFEGEIHFDNLSRLELGALLTALCPSRFFCPADGAEYGWKIGKGKPRGLGSVAPELTGVRLRGNGAALHATYATLDAEVLHEARPELTTECIAEFRAWLAQRAGGEPTTLTFVADLERLLKLPENPRSFFYPDIKDIAGPPPKFDSPTGDADVNPTRGRATRPRAMRPAREIRP